MRQWLPSIQMVSGIVCMNAARGLERISTSCTCDSEEDIGDGDDLLPVSELHGGK